MPALAALALAALGGAIAQPSPDPQEAARILAFTRLAAGRDALVARRFAEAEEEFGEAVRLQPGLALAYYGLGQALMGQSRYPEAADAFLSCRNVFGLARRADARRAREMEIRDLRDTLQALAGRHALTADRFLEMQIEKRLAELQKWSGPVSPWVPPGVTMALGSALFQAGAFEEAEREFEAVRRADPNSGDAENNLAVLYVATGRLDEAEAAIARAERKGVTVSPRLKEELQRRRAASPPSPPPSPSPWPSPSASP
jgi:tetratricopeptide (TPR) repeat protein